MIKLVAFDLDGTIGDTIPMCLKALKKAVTPYVTLNDVSENDILETFGLNEKGMIKKLVGYNWENALDDFYVIYEQMHIMCPRPFDGITELIEKLKKKSILIALVTGKGEKSCAITLRQFNMDTCFDKVKTGNPFKNNKAENFRELLADYKLQPDEMIYIGDTVSDISLNIGEDETQKNITWYGTTTQATQVQFVVKPEDWTEQVGFPAENVISVPAVQSSTSMQGFQNNKATMYGLKKTQLIFIV